MDENERATADATENGRERKTRFRVTVSPTELPMVGEGADASEPAPAALVEGGVLPRPLTEPVAETKPGLHRTYFVYADAAEEARYKARQALKLHLEHPLEVEEAGYVENGVVHVPPEEEATIKASMRDGRKAPGA